MRAVLPGMGARRSGAIVQMSSMGGQVSFPGVAAYSATKFALEGFSEALAQEVAPLGVKVLIVEPGAFRTNLMFSSTASAEIAGYEETVGAFLTMSDKATGNEPGDPAKATAAVLSALGADAPPLRLPLGDMGVDRVLGHLDSVRTEVLAWQKVTRATAFGD